MGETLPELFGEKRHEGVKKPQDPVQDLDKYGATVFRGPMGFGAHSHLHTAKILRLSEDLPVLIEIVDKEEKINAFLPALDEMLGDGLVTLEKVRILTYRATPKS